jgi:parallel beta-helix repeat protein
MEETGLSYLLANTSGYDTLVTISSVFMTAAYRALFVWRRKHAYALAVCLMGAQLGMLPAGAATLIVSNTSASGPGSLQQAILDANGTSGLDTIVFQIPGTGPFTISPGTALPSITAPVVIDGTTQLGYAGTPLIELSGASIAAASDGLSLQTSNSTIRGLAINRFGVAGIHVKGPGGSNSIERNFVGTDPTGTLDRGNGQTTSGLGGVWIDGSAGNRIGGPYATNRNVISANSGAGVYLQNCSGNTVQGNFIGTSVSGTSILANSTNGISLYNANGNLVGGTSTGARNVVSGNGWNGIYLYGTATTGNYVQGNFIGTDVSGTSALGNVVDGVFLEGSRGNTVGGTGTGCANVICRNGHFGVEIGGGASGNLVQGNYIGADATGRGALGNWASGVAISGANSNVIGGTVSQAGNTVSANGLLGILITNAVGNTVAGNLVGTDFTGTNALGNGLAGIQVFGATSNTIGGSSALARNVISGNSGSGLEILAGASGNWIQGNFIGTDQRGHSGLSNRVDGVHIESGGNTIGGAVTGAGNVISGNVNNGISLNGPSATGNIIQGNFIGTDLNGSAAIPNQFAGLGIGNAPSNLIGGTLTGAGNVISGNGSLNKQGGIYLIGAGSTGNLIQGNRIGTDLSGMMALGNRYEGVFATNTGPNTIGGTAPGAGNIISGNLSRGIFLSPAWGTVIQGNLIGVDATGTNALGNGTVVLAAAVELEAGSHDNQVGGSAANAGNRIAFAPYLRSGVRVRTGATNNAVLSNAIFSNDELGIDLGYGIQGNYGVTTNVPCNTDGGANMAQNYPVITQAVSGNGTGIRGTLNSRPNRSYVLQFFANRICNSHGFGEGETYLGQTTVTTASACTVAFLANLPASAGVGSQITATATDTANNTSEFSACFPVAPVPVLSITQAPGSHQVRLAWPNTTTGFVLRETASLSPPIQWSIATNAPANTNGQYVVSASTTNGNRFYVLSFE